MHRLFVHSKASKLYKILKNHLLENIELPKFSGVVEEQKKKFSGVVEEREHK